MSTLGDSSVTDATRRWGILLLAVTVILFGLHRLAVVLSAGDFLYPLEPSESKNTQIAWDLMTGRFGTEGFRLENYIANTGSVHHGSYSSTALAYLLVSKFAGFNMLSVRLVPLLFTVTALAAWLLVVRRVLGLASMVVVGLGLFLVPTTLIGYQLSFLGAHGESVLPLTCAMGSWVVWLQGEGRDWRWGMVTAASLTYAASFSYLLWPIVGVIIVLTFLPPGPKIDWKVALGVCAGAILGAWPVLLIFLLDPSALLYGSIVEESAAIPDSSLTTTLTGGGFDWGVFWKTLRLNLPGGYDHFWILQREAWPFWRGPGFETTAYTIAVLGPAALLPLALLQRSHLARKLGLLVALAPPLAYIAICFASPWKPAVPVRYLIPLQWIGLSAPGVAIGLALHTGCRLHKPIRWGLILVLACVQTWVSLPRVIEAIEPIKLERARHNLVHRQVAYYNLGVGTVWGEQIPQLNDLLDVRTAQGDPRGFGGVQAGMWGSGDRRALSAGAWEAPRLTWARIETGLAEWSERESFKSDEEKDDRVFTARNIGWSVGIRSNWNLDQAAWVLADGAESTFCPQWLSWDQVWFGLGFGYGRVHPNVPADTSPLPLTVSPTGQESFVQGMQEGRALGAVKPMPARPLFESIRGPAT